MTDEEKKRARLAAGALLLAAKRTKKLLLAALAGGAASLALESRQRGLGAAGLVAAVNRASGQVEPALRHGIAKGRADARERGRTRLLAELAALGMVYGKHELRSEEGHLLDEGHAQSAAASLAAQWRSKALAFGTGALRREEELAPALRKAERAMGPALQRTAATETSQAFNDERREALAIADRHAEEEHLGREWVTMLDACEDCWAMNGEVAAAGEYFSGGNEPGHMHPNCQCTAMPILMDAAGRKIAEVEEEAAPVAAVAAEESVAARAEALPEAEVAEEPLAAEELAAPAEEAPALDEVLDEEAVGKVAAKEVSDLLEAKETEPVVVPPAGTPEPAPPPSKEVSKVSELGLVNADYMRTGMKDLTRVRAAFAGATPDEANAIATGRIPALDSGKFLPLPKVTIDSGEVFLQDGRHRLTAAMEAGATEMKVQIRTYTRSGKSRYQEGVVSIYPKGEGPSPVQIEYPAGQEPKPHP